jgi:deoxyribonuclease V
MPPPVAGAAPGHREGGRIVDRPEPRKQGAPEDEKGAQGMPQRGLPGGSARRVAGGVRPVIPCGLDLSPAEAVREQDRLRGLVRRERLPVGRVRLVAGCDCAIAGDHLCAAVLVFTLPGLKVVDAAEAVVPTRFPYVPGLLSFRELPPLLAALARLRECPDAIICDGQGIAHPRRFGLACHLGVLLDLPTVGCAKSRLIGAHDEPGPLRGDRVPLRDGRETIGTVLRTRERVRPLYISAGHRVTRRDAEVLVLSCGAGYRLPEPTRQADAAVGRLARSLR